MVSSLFIHLSVDVSYYVSGTVDSAAMNTGVHVSLSVRIFSGYMPRRGFAGLHDKLYF